MVKFPLPQQEHALYKQKVVKIKLFYMNPFIANRFFLWVLIVASSNIKAQVLPTPFTTGTKVNVVRTWEALVPDKTPETFKARPFNEVKQTFQYTDGFGRPIQTVIKKGSLVTGGSPLDFVEAANFDEFGRERLNYLPFAANDAFIYTGNTPPVTGSKNLSVDDGNFKINPFQQQRKFGEAQYTGESYFYSTTTYDGSPLNRVTNVKMAGNKWNTDATYKGMSVEYDINKAVENVRLWNIDYTAGSIPVSSNDINGYYADGKLSKTILKDDKDKMTIEYNDLNGNVILKKVQDLEVATGLNLNGHKGWLCTYYVYDDFNRLRYTIPPKAVELVDPATNGSAVTWVIDAAIKNGLCFYNEYDERGRLVVKHAPDAGEVWLVYDKRDRLVLMQDENQRSRLVAGILSPQWSFSLYDELDRNTITGVVESNSSRDYIASQVNSIAATPVIVSVFTGVTNESVAAFMPVTSIVSNNITVNSVLYYDEYTSDSKPFESVTNVSFAVTDNLNIDPLVNTNRLLNMQTGSKLRVLDDKYFTISASDDKFLAATIYYDDKERVLQSFNENIRNGTDKAVFQYDWSGKLLCSNVSNSGFKLRKSTFLLTTITKPEYDLLGRPVKNYKLFTFNASDISDNSKYKLLSELSYDALGLLKSKKIGAKPGLPTEPLETQDFSYDMHGWLTGINKEYALASAGANTSQWNRMFGFYLGYDNLDNNFAKPLYNGNITGVRWRSQGDNIPRKYDYDYDNVNRFTKATFSQIDKFGSAGAGTVFTNSTVNLSSSIGGYDLNGNIRSAINYGILPGMAGGIVIDNLSYTYAAKSNKLLKVLDAGATNQTGLLGDFKKANLSGTDDYFYDLNGSLTTDKNKLITDVSGSGSGIIYNFLNLPQVVTINGKSKTEYIYDAAGNKLAKIVTELATNVITITYFVGNCVFKNSVLDYILHEEGKLRIMMPQALCSPGCANYVNSLNVTSNTSMSKKTVNGTFILSGVWDYFIKDNLSNVRMVLTEEGHKQQMKCSMETTGTPNPQNEEQATFGKPVPVTGNEVTATRWPRTSTNWTSNLSANVCKLINIAGANPSLSVGPNSLLKVMAGDVIDATAKYYYSTTVSATNTGIFNNIANSLVGVLSTGTNVSALIKSNVVPLLPTNGVTNPISNFISTLPPTQPATTPRAFLNIVFFDEQFRFVSNGSTVQMVESITAPATFKDTDLRLSGVKAPNNGYVYIYLSNESNNIPVYFDDFTVVHTRGAITEDDAYYPSGLRIAGISGQAAFKPVSKYGYQGDFAEEDAETGYNEFDLRTYDPQIGRWLQADPYDEFPSPYSGMGNDPVNNVDPDGGCTWCESILNSLTLPTVFINSAAKKVVPALNNGILSKLGTFFNTVGTVVVNANKGIYNETAYRATTHWEENKSWVKSTASTLASNAKANWEAGNTMPQQFVNDAMANPISLIGPAELKASARLLGMEIKAAKTGWKVGEPITNLTAKGNIPAWSTVGHL